MELLVIAPDDPRSPDVQALLAAHLAFANDQSPTEHVHALDITGLLRPEISFYSARRDNVVLGVGALHQLDETHAELKSMHTAAVARGQGVGAAMVAHLLMVCRERGYARVSLETGTPTAFAPAHRLYEKAGFSRCEPFGGYTVNDFSLCMTMKL